MVIGFYEPRNVTNDGVKHPDSKHHFLLLLLLGCWQTAYWCMTETKGGACSPTDIIIVSLHWNGSLMVENAGYASMSR